SSAHTEPRHPFPTRRSSDLEPDGHTISYTYTAAGDLDTVSYPNGTTYTYTYDGNHNLVSVHTPGNPPFSILEYDAGGRLIAVTRSEEHTSELQSRFDLVCRL